jgi:hypothetical protein
MAKCKGPNGSHRFDYLPERARVLVCVDCGRTEHDLRTFGESLLDELEDHAHTEAIASQAVRRDATIDTAEAGSAARPVGELGAPERAGGAADDEAQTSHAPRSRDERLTPPSDAELRLLQLYTVLQDKESRLAELQSRRHEEENWRRRAIDAEDRVRFLERQFGAHTGSICELRAQVEALQSSMVAAAARVEALEARTQNWTEHPDAQIPWCPSCGSFPKIDEDGCCVTCGATTGYVPTVASQETVDEVLRRLEAQPATVERVREALHKFVEYRLRPGSGSYSKDADDFAPEAARIIGVVPDQHRIRDLESKLNRAHGHTEILRKERDEARESWGNAENGWSKTADELRKVKVQLDNALSGGEGVIAQLTKERDELKAKLSGLQERTHMLENANKTLGWISGESAKERDASRKRIEELEADVAQRVSACRDDVAEANSTRDTALRRAEDAEKLLAALKTRESPNPCACHCPDCTEQEKCMQEHCGGDACGKEEHPCK